jgi:predicted nucleic acid-binding protein
MRASADAYPDSSFLVSLHRADANHTLACAHLVANAQTLVFTPLHRIEVRNALRNAAACGDLAPEELRQAFRQVDQDLRDGLLVHTQIEWTDVFRRADDLSHTHASREGQRTLDLLHVAIALVIGAKMFLSFDKRQRGLAAAAGLDVRP